MLLTLAATLTCEQAPRKGRKMRGRRLAGWEGDGGKGKWRNGEEMNEAERKKNGGWNGRGKMKRRKGEAGKNEGRGDGEEQKWLYVKNKFKGQ